MDVESNDQTRSSSINSKWLPENMGSQSYNRCASGCVSEVDTARIKAAGAPHSSDWLNAPPITAVGLRLSDDAIRVTVGYRLGSVT